MTSEVSENIRDAIEDAPEEAESMRVRAVLMLAIERHIKARGWTQERAAHHFGVTQPRISDLMRGKISLFSIDSLIEMAVAIGVCVSVRNAPADWRKTRSALAGNAGARDGPASGGLSLIASMSSSMINEI